MADSDRAAREFEQRLTTWLQVELKIKPSRAHGTNAQFWKFLFEGEETRVSVLGPSDTAAPPSGGLDWLLRIEEPAPPKFAKLIAGFFKADSAIERVMNTGMTRTQFKSADLLPEGPLAAPSARGMTREEALARMKSLGATVEKSFGGLWLSLKFKEGLAESDFACLSAIADLAMLDLTRTDLTDAGLAHIAALEGLGALILDANPITDAGLSSLAGLRNLEVMRLIDTKVAGPGLAHLKGMNRLTSLNLAGTKITDEGLAYVADLAPLETLFLYETKITDAGLGHLARLPRLRELDLHLSHVSEEGVARLRQSRPEMKIQAYALKG